MADDITLNTLSGGGPTVATDDSGTGHVQIIKLAYSADGSRVPITADANGLKVSVGNTTGATLSQGSAAPTATATSIAAASATRRSITITNTGTVTVNVGGSGVTASTGVPLVVGASATFDGAAAAQFYGITASGTGAVVYMGESD